MNWCSFIFFISLRCINYFVAHVTWICYLYIGCAYFSFWKSYDILWLWIHLPLSLCLPKLRQDNIFLTAVKLVIRKRRQPDKSAHELFKDLWLKERDKTEDEDAEAAEEQNKPTSSRLASAVSLGLFYLRLRVSIALLIGNVRQMMLPDSKSPTLFDGWSPSFTGVFRASLWIDLISLWLLLQWSWLRQCRLCCQLGCCRYYLWMLVVVFLGALVMEIPMNAATYFYTDPNWCGFDHVKAWNATKDAVVGGSG